MEIPNAPDCELTVQAAIVHVTSTIPMMSYLETGDISQAKGRMGISYLYLNEYSGLQQL